jgi:hypothetical protein
MFLVKRLVLSLFFAFMCWGVKGQFDSLPKRILNNIDTLRFVRTDFGAFKIVPYIAPTYSPETEWMISGGGLLTFKVHERDNLLNLSSVPFSFGYSSTGAINATIAHEIFWTNDQLRIIGEWQFRNMPDNYWGVGYVNGMRVMNPDSTTAYRREFWQFKQRVMISLGGHLFLGPVIDINETKARNVNAYMANDEFVEGQGNDFFNTGVGIYFEHDSRDVPQNAYMGWYIGGNLINYVNWFGNKSEFVTIEVDYRQYKTLFRPGTTLAWQIKSKLCAGSIVPWTDMAMLGGHQNLRGYTLGRFRDEKMGSAIMEYRHMFRRKKINKAGNFNSRFGFVTWIGAGAISAGVDKITNWLPNAGVGARFEVRSRMNIRIDYGVGRGERAFYVTFKEAF